MVKSPFTSSFFCLPPYNGRVTLPSGNASVLSSVDQPPRRWRLGAVQFLNSRPLIDSLESAPDLDLHLDVPSRLLEGLETGRLDLALCPIIDYQRSRVPLMVVPVGAIGCDGPTYTVRLFSRVPLQQIRRVHADTDSHSSIVLMQIILARCWDLRPQIVPWKNSHLSPEDSDAIETLLLIGDKVVIAAPSAQEYPFQLDLGQAWKELTGLPFVFAVWMARRGTDPTALAVRLQTVRLTNQARLGQIAARYAPLLGWPLSLAHIYLTRYLRFEVDEPQIQAIQTFFDLAHQEGLISHLRALQLWQLPAPAFPAPASATR